MYLISSKSILCVIPRIKRLTASNTVLTVVGLMNTPLCSTPKVREKNTIKCTFLRNNPLTSLGGFLTFTTFMSNDPLRENPSH